MRENKKEKDREVKDRWKNSGKEGILGGERDKSMRE